MEDGKMNINAKIGWHAGMELTAQTFIELDKNLDRQQQITRRIANGGDFGIIPAAPFHCQGAFVKKTLEITPLTFMALLTVPVARFLFDVSGVRTKNMQYILLPGLDKKTDFAKSASSQAAVLSAAEELLRAAV